MVERGILFDEAVGEFEKRFIKRVLERTKTAISAGLLNSSEFTAIP